MLRRFTALLAIAAFAGFLLAAQPPTPTAPPDFAVDQTPAKPAPFKTKLVELGDQNPKLKGIKVPEGFKVEIVAEDPVIVNPVGMTFGPDGTLFVMEWKPDPGREWFQFTETFKFRDGTVREVATMKKHIFDNIKQLKFNPKTNTYDQAEVVLTEELPSTMLFHEEWLYVASRGSVRRYKQTQPGGKWDKREIVAQGFCGFHHHQVSGLTMGHDGLLYITTGDDDNIVEGSDGSRASVMRTGAVFRCKPDGSKIELYSLGYRNPYRDIVADENFNWFHSDNDQEDGSKFQGCRIVHVAEESDYGWRLKDGVRCCRTDFVRGAVAGERPGKLPPMIKTGRGSPAGLLIYGGMHLPDHYRGLFYYPDVFRKLVRAYKVEPKGSTFAVTGEMEFMTGTDPLFRPCQMVTGPDGAIYVCDWRTDSGGAGKLWGDGVHGRIYKLTWAGTQEHPAIPPRSLDSWKKKAGAETDTQTLLESLRGDDSSLRFLAQRELMRRAKTQPDEIRKLFREEFATEVAGRQPTKILALGGLIQLWNDDTEAFFVKQLRSGNPEIQRTAVEALGWKLKPKDGKHETEIARLLSDQNLAVRRAAALALGRIASEGTADILVNALKADDGKDVFLSDAYLRALERLGKPGIVALLTLADSGNNKDSQLVATLFLALRSKVAVEALPEMLANVHITNEQRAELIRSYAFYQFDTPLNYDPLAEFLTKRRNFPAEVKIAGLDTLAYCGGLNSAKATDFVVGLLSAKEDDVRMAAIQAVETSRITGASKKLLEVLADTKRTVPERLAVLRAARAVGDASLAKETLALLERADEPAALKAEALRTATALDAAAARKVAEKLLDSSDPVLLLEAVQSLGSTKEGAKMIGERYLAKKLPADMFPRVSEVLRKFPGDADIEKLNAEVLRGGLKLSLEPAQIEKLRLEVLRKGDAKKGKAVYLNTALVACASCHKMEGAGGNVGPDLTRVWDTVTIEKMLEAIIEPSKEIKEGYQSNKASTLDGQVYMGLKVFESPKEVTLRESNGRDVRLKKEDLDKFEPSKISLMPDNVVSQLSYEQFIDLLAFLKSQGQQESLRGQVLDFNILVGADADVKKTHALEAKPDVSAKVEGFKTGWQSKGVAPEGYLHLKPLIPSETTGVYLLTYVQSTKKQTVTATLLADDAVRVVAAGKQVFERAVVKQQRFEVEEKFELELETGWTPILLKLSTNGQTHRVGLHLKGEALRVGARPE